MSVTETPKVEETTPLPTKAVETTTAAPTETVAPATTTEPTTTSTDATPATTELAKDETVVEATPASEGVLGYKAPGLLKQFRFVKHFFWVSEEPLGQEAISSYIKTAEKTEHHHAAAWAQETGKGCLFYAKRAEDKATPAGIILLAEASNVAKIGATDFSFKVGSHTHKFEASGAIERDSWVVTIQKIVDESKDLKADVTGRESYKKSIEGLAFAPAAATAATISPAKTEERKKSVDATPVAASTAETPAVATEEPVAPLEDTEAKREAKEKAKKERSQSRKRNSVFGLFGKKDEDKAAEKAEKEHKKEEKEHKKEEAKIEKEEKKIEAEHKKEEAKAEHDSSKAKEAAEAAAVAAAPAAVVAAVDKKEEEKKDEKPLEEVTTPTEKKAKRSSVFGGFFNKNKVTSPSQEKTIDEAGPAVPAKDETSAVSETAPKLDEPIDTKPIDTAAVTAPVDNADATPVTAAPAVEASKTAEPVTATETTTPKTEKKSFLAGLMKKEKKEEPKKEEIKTNEEAAVESPTPAAVATTETTEPAAVTPAKEAEAPKEERPAREKRRTSLFGSLGTLKRKTDKSPEPSSVAGDETKTEQKREKSPMPSKLGGLFRKNSKATKPETTTEEAKKGEVAPVADSTATPTATAETPANATIVEPKGDSAIIGDVVPEALTAGTVHDAVTVKPEETKTTT